jgi:hypothetical protein
MTTSKNDILTANLDTAEIIAVRKCDTFGGQRQCSLLALRDGRFAVVVIVRFDSGNHLTEAPYIYTDEATARGKLDFESRY